MITFGSNLLTAPSKSTRNGATAAPIFEVASKKQKVAFLVGVGKSSEVCSPQQSQNMVATAFPKMTRDGWSQISPSGTPRRAIPREPHVTKAKTSVKTRPTCNQNISIAINPHCFNMGDLPLFFSKCEILAFIKDLKPWMKSDKLSSNVS